jgi:peptidoglycan L-alanyl-D-glutamate endopeptidase CwlK
MMAPRIFPKYNGLPGATPVKFSPKSEARLNEVDPKLAELMRRVEAAHPDAFEITEARRTPERQADLVAQGKSQTYKSKHLTGNAVDIALMGPDGKPNWDFEAYRPIAATAKAVAAELGIPDFVWGGDWKTLKDGVHFQVGGPGSPAMASAQAPAGTAPAAPAGMATVTAPAPVVPAENAQMSIWDRIALMGAAMAQPQAAPVQAQAPQIMPMQRTAYVAPERDTLDPYLKFFASLR